MIGTVITMAPAAIDPVGSSNCELPVKLTIATGAVIAFIFIKLFGTSAPGADDGNR